MKRKTRISRHRYSLLALLLALLMIILLPILALQYYNYAWSSQVITQELTDSASANVSYLRESFSEKITSIVEQQEYLLTAYMDVSSYFTYARTLSPGNRYVLEARLGDHVQNICYGHPLLHSFSLYYPTLNKQFSAAYDPSTTHLQSMISGIADVDSLVRQFDKRTSVISQEGGELFIIHGRRIGDGLPQYLTKVVLDNAAIGELLGAYGVYPSQTAYLIHWDSGFFVSSDEAGDTLGRELARQFTPERSDAVYSLSFTSGSHDFTAFCADVPILGVTFVHLIDNNVLNAIPSRLHTMIVMAILLTIMVSLLYFLAVHFMVNRPVRELMNCFSAAGQGDLAKRMDVYPTQEFLSLSSGYNAMADRLDHLINENYQQTILLQQAQLRQLHSQIEPHFLYNSFFMLRHTIASEEIEKAEEICGYLGNYFRFITQLNSQFLPLKEEYDNAMNYVAIQQMRFVSRLRMEIAPLPESLSPYIVPVLILQPLIENAIEHGIPAHAAVMKLSFEDVGADFFIRVEDNGDTLTDERLAELDSRIHADHGVQGTHALINIHHRLHLFYGPQYGLTLSRSSLGGLCVTMRLRKTFTIPHEISKEATKHVSQHSDRR